MCSVGPHARRRSRGSSPSALSATAGRGLAALGSRMTTGGTGIPRLQELSYLEVAAAAIADRCTFEEIRRRLVDHMTALGEASPGTGNTALSHAAVDNPKRYVRNVTEALKELMKLGLLERASLPSSATSAYAHRLARYQLTDEGESWVGALVSDRREAYDQLTVRLMETHPQFGGFLESVGAMGSDSGRDSFVIPLLRWGDVAEPRTRERYVGALADWAATRRSHCRLRMDRYRPRDCDVRRRLCRRDRDPSGRT